MKKIIITLLGLASFAMAAPTTTIPENLSIGGVAVAEALARAKTLDIFCTGEIGSTGFFHTTVDIGGINSPDEILEKVKGVKVSLTVCDPKSEINLEAGITDAKGYQLFQARNRFELKKKGTSSDYEPAEYAGHLYFVLTDFRVTVPGAEKAEVVALDGTVYELNVYPGGLVEMPGWMNYGQNSELVINGNIRYDMNTGLRLKVQKIKVPITGINFAGLSKPNLWDGVNVLYTYPGYGTPNAFQIKVDTSKKFKVRVQSGEEWDWERTSPINIWVARLKDLRPGGKGWKVLSYTDDMEVSVPSAGEYIVFPEYDHTDIGYRIQSPGGPPQG